MILNQLPANIKYYRNRNNWTQQQLANELNISRSVIAKWENGDVTPDLHAVVKLSILFNQPIDYLIGIGSKTAHQLSEFQQLYQAKAEEPDVYNNELAEILDYLTKHPMLKEQIQEMQHIPIKKQKAIHRMLKSIIAESKRL
ncbi:hypothetical protein BN1058_01524 [Paraliobacillus sp. PM-2]|uniref:helix-turn-helix domain-containing protein n=1 Tax=Paraliobacillus sp. PM-2 TaxID=1462524 RepID=UPI00061B96C0|nr:helix-turn-helix transcriptional regulator [Paraliobacillus sp. PM-2]CQR47218.1 hypothetical protein BN1058_01524 [Paraliobacillus sp. PM-2]